MGQPYTTFTGMAGTIQRMKEEADRREQEKRRKEEEAARLSDWRRTIPIGPPSVEESTYIKTGVKVPKVQQPKPQVQRPVVGGEPEPTKAPLLTRTPVIGEQQPQAPVIEPEEERPRPRPPVSMTGITPTQPFQQSLAQWRGEVPQLPPRNTLAAASPLLLPNLLSNLAPTVGPAVNAAAEATGNVFQDWWNKYNVPPTGPTAQLLGLGTSPMSNDVFNAGVDLTMQSIARNTEERKASSVQQGPGKQAWGHVWTGIKNAADLLGLANVAMNSRIVTPDGQTLGMQAAKLFSVGDRAVANADLSRTSPTTVTLDDGRTWTMPDANQYDFHPSIHPNVWVQLFNPTELAEYWDLADKEVIAALTPTPEQKAGNTAQQLTQARNFAIAQMNMGVVPASASFDDALNYPIQISRLQKQATDMAARADQMQDPVQRGIMLAEAGRMGAESVKLREMTPLDIFNKNADWVRGGLWDAATDPTMAIDIFTDWTKLGVAARRYQQGVDVMNLGQQAVGGNKRFIDTIKDNPLVEWAKTNLSKGMVDMYVNFDVVTNLLSGVVTKGDIKQVITRYANGTLDQGIPVELLTSPHAAMQAADGVMPFGWAGINDHRAVKARKSLTDAVQWVNNLPSLQGAADEIANRTEVMADLLGMLTRAGAQRYGVGTLAGVPYGAVKFNVSPTAGNKAVIQYIDGAKQVIGQSAEYALTEANRVAKQLGQSLAKGQEFKTNYVKAVADFERNILSTYTINSSGGGLVTNAVGGNVTTQMDQGFGTAIRSTKDNMDYLATKGEGLIPNARLAQGAGKIEAGENLTNVISATGFQSGKDWQSRLGQILNATTFGIAGAGRKLRQGTAEILGIPFGEEAIALNAYTAAYRNFVERELPKAIGGEMQALLQSKGISDPTVVKNMVDQVVQAGLAGSRVDVARTFQDLANGKVAVSLRGLSPAFAHFFTPEQVLQIDTAFRNLRPENLGDVQRMLADMVTVQRGKINTELANGRTINGRRFFTEMDDLKDIADYTDVLQNAARMTGGNIDEAIERGRVLGEAQAQINASMLQLLQWAQEKPQVADYVTNVWGHVNHLKDVTRARIADLFEGAREYADDIGGELPQPENSIGFNWARVKDLVQTQWDGFARDAMAVIEDARNHILTGDVYVNLQQGIPSTLQGVDPAAFRYGPAELLSDLSIDPAAAMDYLKQGIRSAPTDPVWEAAINTYRQVQDKYVAEMYVALSRYPNMVSFDEFTSAFADVKRVRNQTLARVKGIEATLNSAEVQAVVSERTKWTTILEKAQTTEWNKYWEYSFTRFHAGAMRILETNAMMQTDELLEFKLAGSDMPWNLVGPSNKYPGKWVGRTADGQMKDGLTATNSGAGVPLALVERYKEFQKAAEMDFNESIARIASRVRTGVSDGLTARPANAASVDQMIQRAAVGAKDMVTQIRQGVQQYMANYENMPLNTPEQLPQWFSDGLDTAQMVMAQKLQEIAVANANGYGRLGMDTINEFNKRILPMFDNVLSGAKRYGNEMMSMSVLDYTNQYHPEVLLSVFSPYHFFFTRQGKNAVERMMFNPKVHTQLARYYRSVEGQNRAEDQPNRNIQMLPGGATIGDTRYNTTANLLARWIPTAPLFFMHGWANADRANQGYDYAVKAAKEQAFPASGQQWLGNIIVLNEMAKEFGLGTYPHWDALLGMAAGEKMETDGWLASMSPLHRTLGWGAVNLALWAKEQGIPLVPETAMVYAQAATPNYRQYLNARQASFEVNRGNLSETEGQFVQDVARQQRTGEAPLPSQGLFAPNAVKQFDKVQGQVATEYFIRNLISWITGAPIAADYGPERNLRAGQQTARNSGYSVANPAGSQAARFSFTDPGSDNFVPGLASFNSQYAVMNETNPNNPDEPVKRPGEKAGTREYWQEFEVISKRQLAEEQAAYIAHPEWAEPDGLDDTNEKKEFDNALRDKYQAERDALFEKYPDIVASWDKGSAGDPTFAMRPSEEARKAQSELYDRAKDEAASLNPYNNTELESNSKNWNAYYQAVEDNLTRLMSEHQSGDRGAAWTPISGMMPAATPTKFPDTPQEVIEQEGNKYKSDARIEVEKDLDAAFEELAAKKSKGGAGGGGEWTDDWAAYRALPDTDAKRQYLLDHPEFADEYLRFVRSKDKDAEAWWLKEQKPFVPYERRPFVPYSYSYGGGGGGGGGGEFMPVDIRRVESQRSDTPEWGGWGGGGGSDWRKYLNLDSGLLKGWRR